MKAKSSLIAFAAILCILSGCKKEESKWEFNWTTEFQRAIKFAKTEKYSDVQNELLNDGYVNAATTDSLDSYIKTDLETGEIYFYTFTQQNNKLVTISFGAKPGANATSKILSSESYYELVKFIGEKYTPAEGVDFIFNHCTYMDSDGKAQQLAKYADYLAQAATVSAYSSTAIWDCTVDKTNHIWIEREPNLLKTQCVTIGK